MSRYGPTPTVNDIVHRLVELSELLDKATAEIAVLDEAAVRAKAAAEVAFAKAFLKAQGAVDVRKQLAVVESADQRFAAEAAEQLVRACKERLRTLRDQLEIHRSLGAAIRSEFAATGYTQP